MSILRCVIYINPICICSHFFIGLTIDLWWQNPSFIKGSQKLAWCMLSRHINRIKVWIKIEGSPCTMTLTRFWWTVTRFEAWTKKAQFCCHSKRWNLLLPHATLRFWHIVHNHTSTSFLASVLWNGALIGPARGHPNFAPGNTLASVFDILCQKNKNEAMLVNLMELFEFNHPSSL